MGQLLPLLEYPFYPVEGSGVGARVMHEASHMHDHDRKLAGYEECIQLSPRKVYQGGVRQGGAGG